MVHGIKGVNEALDDYFKVEEIEGVGCEVCDKNTTATRGPMLARLPPVLTFNLIRIKYDMITFDRIKINDRFEYPLELDMSKYLAPTEKAQAQKTEPDLVNYELKAVIIHRGGPYGGHYHAYIKDDFKEGNWNLKVPEKFEGEPVEIKSKKEENTHQQEKKDEDIKDEEKKPEEEKKPQEEENE
jgi:ubiquitin carboxyl-terminal hydrolase 40